MSVRPDQIAVGQRVLYQPIIHGPRSFAATIAGAPWQLSGGGRWVVTLVDLPPEYSQYAGLNPPRTRVVAASLEAIYLPSPPRRTKRDSRKKSIYMPSSMIEELNAEARRLDVSISRMVQLCVARGLRELRRSEAPELTL